MELLMPQKTPQPTVVLHAIGRLNTGGLERRTLELMSATRDGSIEHIICVTSGKAGSLDADFQRLGVKLYYLPIFSALFPVRFLRLLRREQVSAVQSYLMYVSGFVVFLAHLARVPVRIVQFRSDGAHSSGVLAGIKRFLLRAMISFSATHIVGLTPENLRLAWKPNWQSNPRCLVLPSGVEIHPLPSQTVAEIKDFKGTPIILHVGRGELKTKNRTRALRIFSRFAANQPDAVLLFVGRHGRTPEESEANHRYWNELARQLGVRERTYFLGERDDVLALMASADALLVTSSLEGLPGVVLEALSMGVPVVSSDVPGACYVAEFSTWVKIRSLADPDQSWVQSLTTLPLPLSVQQRKDISEEFATTIFNLNVLKREYVRLWQGKTTSFTGR